MVEYVVSNITVSNNGSIEFCIMEDVFNRLKMYFNGNVEKALMFLFETMRSFFVFSKGNINAYISSREVVDGCDLLRIRFCNTAVRSPSVVWSESFESLGDCRCAAVKFHTIRDAIDYCCKIANYEYVWSSLLKTEDGEYCLIMYPEAESACCAISALEFGDVVFRLPKSECIISDGQAIKHLSEL